MTVNASALGLDKPVLIGEFASHGTGRSVDTLYRHAFDGNYNGVLDWSLLGGDGEDDMATADKGMRTLASEPSVVSSAALSNEVNPPPDTCTCSDVPPDNRYTCAQQASFGKCHEQWMRGYCCKSCFACAKSCSGL